MKSFLHVGCGRNRQQTTPFARAKEPWREVTIDVDPSSAPDFVGSMTDMSVIPDHSFDAVFSHHSIEHIFPHEVPLALGEFRRVLKLDGFALIACPDLQGVCALVAEDNLAPLARDSMGFITALDMIYGHSGAIAAGQHYMAHRTGFTLASLSAALTEARFASNAIARRPLPALDLWAIAFVAPQDEDHVRAQAEIYFPFQ